MIPSFCPWKVVTFFGKEHLNWSSNSGVTIGRSWTIEFGKVHYLFGKKINTECQNTIFWGTETKMDDSFLLPVKSSYIFYKEHVNWSSISGVMIRRSWKIKFGKLKIGVTKKIMDMIFQLLPIITPQIFDQLTCSLLKNVTTFHRQQDWIIHFCLSPNKRAVLAIWMKLHNHVWKSPLSFW